MKRTDYKNMKQDLLAWRDRMVKKVTVKVEELYDQKLAALEILFNGTFSNTTTKRSCAPRQQREVVSAKGKRGRKPKLKRGVLMKSIRKFIRSNQDIFTSDIVHAFVLKDIPQISPTRSRRVIPTLLHHLRLLGTLHAVGYIGEHTAYSTRRDIKKPLYILPERLKAVLRKEIVSKRYENFTCQTLSQYLEHTFPGALEYFNANTVSKTMCILRDEGILKVTGRDPKGCTGVPRNVWNLVSERVPQSDLGVTVQ